MEKFPKLDEVEKLDSLDSYYIDGILGEGRDYEDYELSVKEKALGWLAGFSGAFLVLFTFYVKFIFAIPICMLCGFYGMKVYRDHLCQKNKKLLLLQFVSLLDCLKNSYLSGSNSFESFAMARDDLVTQYGENSLIVIELERILGSFNNNISLESTLEDFARRSNLEDIENFVGAFQICTKFGGDLAEVLKEVDEIIKNKVATEMEIATTISDKTTELYVMMIMPLLILLALRGAGGFEKTTVENAIVKVISLSLFIGAYYIGSKIIDIKV